MKTLEPTNRIDYALFDVKRTIGDGDYEEHQHSAVEMMLVLGGTVRHVVNGVELEARGGDVFVVHPNVSHELRGRRAFDEVKIACVPGAFKALVPDLARTTGFKTLFVPPAAGGERVSWLRLPLEEFSQCRQIALTMLAEYAEKRLGWKAAMHAGLCMLLVAMLRGHQRRQVGECPSLGRLHETISFMEKNFRRRLTLDELARRAGMSRSQFVRVFRVRCGTSPVDYLIDLRLDAAQRMMLASAKSIGEIALACGFPDSNYFSRQFRQKLGVSPKNCRSGRQPA
jgi:AraC-like DNA-binding protein